MKSFMIMMPNSSLLEKKLGVVHTTHSHLLPHLSYYLLRCHIKMTQWQPLSGGTCLRRHILTHLLTPSLARSLILTYFSPPSTFNIYDFITGKGSFGMCALTPSPLFLWRPRQYLVPPGEEGEMTKTRERECVSKLNGANWYWYFPWRK